MGELLGATAGAKETVSAQARHLSCVEERLASQLEAVQASVQVYQNKMGALEDALETSMNTIRGLTKHQALLTKLASEAEEESTLSSHQAQMQELALDLASRVTHLERMDRTLRASAMEEATLAEDAQMRLQLQELQELKAKGCTKRCWMWLQELRNTQCIWPLLGPGWRHWKISTLGPEPP